MGSPSVSMIDTATSGAHDTALDQGDVAVGERPTMAAGSSAASVTIAAPERTRRGSASPPKADPAGHQPVEHLARPQFPEHGVRKRHRLGVARSHRRATALATLLSNAIRAASEWSPRRADRTW